MKTNKKGFTLIELLVVIAIIGILSGVVLTSLSSARTKANDAKVQSQLGGIRTAAEVYYADNNNYGTAATACNAGMFADSKLSPYLADLPSYAGTYKGCVSTGTAYAVYAMLPSSPATSGTTATYWCVDSSGASKKITNITSTPSITTGVCPS